MKKPKRLGKSPDFLSSLLRTAYLPVEIPPAITSRNFADYCRSEYAALEAQTKSIIRLTTNFNTYTVPKERNSRRHLALVHPIAQLGLSLLLTKHRSTLKKLVRASSTSLYRTNENPKRGRAFSGLDFRRREREVSRICFEYPIVLKADVARFFYAIYTHSIPWAILGKRKVKKLLKDSKKKLDAHWSNDFDVSLQSCQSRQTLGIPVGPDTSRLLAEVLMAAVEREPKLEKLINKEGAIRLVDDFFLGFDDQHLAEQALGELRDSLWQYSLQLNDDKTSIVSSAEIFRERWRIDFSRFVVRENSRSAQLADVRNLVDLTLQWCGAEHTATPAIWCCKRLAGLKRLEWNLLVVLQSMFRLARDYPRCTSYVAEFLINNHILCAEDEVAGAVVKWVKSVLKKHVQRAHHFEVSWALVVAGVFQIKLEERDVFFGEKPSAAILAILGMLRERQLLSVPLSKWSWRAGFTKDDVVGEDWLIFYEAVRRGWTKDSKIVAAIKSQPILAGMLAARVTFLDDRIFDAASIDLAKRVFTPRKKGRGTPSGKKKMPRHRVRGWADVIGYD